MPRWSRKPPSPPNGRVLVQFRVADQRGCAGRHVGVLAFLLRTSVFTDALLQQQTRPHKDFDALVAFGDLVALTEVLAARGFGVKELWSENRWVDHPGAVKLLGRASTAGHEVATAFVLRNGQGHELDIHVLTVDERGDGIPAWQAELRYPPEALAGRGVIGNTPLRCLSAAMQMHTHTGYVLQAKDRRDLRLLHERFGIAYVEDAQRWPQGED